MISAVFHVGSRHKRVLSAQLRKSAHATKEHQYEAVNVGEDCLRELFEFPRHCSISALGVY